MWPLFLKRYILEVPEREGQWRAQRPNPDPQRKGRSRGPRGKQQRGRGARELQERRQRCSWPQEGKVQEAGRWQRPPHWRSAGTKVRADAQRRKRGGRQHRARNRKPRGATARSGPRTFAGQPRRNARRRQDGGRSGRNGKDHRAIAARACCARTTAAF